MGEAGCWLCPPTSLPHPTEKAACLSGASQQRPSGWSKGLYPCSKVNGVGYTFGRVGDLPGVFLPLPLYWAMILQNYG